MRHVAILPTLLLAAAAAQAGTYTNNFNNSDPAVVLTTGNPGYQQWDISQPYAATKPWDVSTTDGTYSISGRPNLPDSYISQYPAAAAGGSTNFRMEITLPGLSSFTLAGVESVNVQWTVGNLQSYGGWGIALLTASGSSQDMLYLGGQGVVYSNTFINGVHSLTLSNLGTDLQGRTFTKVALLGSATYIFGPSGPSAPKGQYLDYTFDSVTLVASAAPVPEPSTYGLALGGLALVGAVIRRRRSK